MTYSNKVADLMGVNADEMMKVKNIIITNSNDVNHIQSDQIGRFIRLWASF